MEKIRPFLPMAFLYLIFCGIVVTLKIEATVMEMLHLFLPPSLVYLVISGIVVAYNIVFWSIRTRRLPSLDPIPALAVSAFCVWIAYQGIDNFLWLTGLALFVNFLCCAFALVFSFSPFNSPKARDQALFARVEQP